MILTPLQKLPKNVGDLVKIIVAKGFEWLTKVQKIAKSGHTDCSRQLHFCRDKKFPISALMQVHCGICRPLQQV